MKILTSNTSHGAFKAIVEEINSRFDASNPFDEHIVLAPDRFTAFVERALLSSLKKGSAFGIEVASFVRLAGKILGKNVNKCLTPEGSVMLIAEAITASNEEGALRFFGKVAKKDGFANELYAALTSLRNGGIDPNGLKEKAETIEDKTLKSKLEDIATIYAKYLDLLEEKDHSDSSTRLEKLAIYLKENPDVLRGKHFYCTDIYEFSALELDILKSINEHAASFTIAITSGKGNPNERIYPDSLINKLRTIDSKCEIKAKNEDNLEAPFECISKNLFAYKAPAVPVKNVSEDGEEKVVLRVAKNRYDEVLSLVVDINRKVREGARYKDIEVFVGDLNGYQAELKSAFVRYGIPFF